MARHSPLSAGQAGPAAAVQAEHLPLEWNASVAAGCWTASHYVFCIYVISDCEPTRRLPPTYSLWLAGRGVLLGKRIGATASSIRFGSC